VFRGLLNNALDHIKVAEALIETHDQYIKQQPAESQSLVKVYTVSSCVTRLYAIYERFVESLLADYLDAIPELTPYNLLSDGLKNEYRIGISHILSKLDAERYSHLTHQNIIHWYHEALTSEEKYRFVVEALTRHDQNLRLNIIENLVSRLGLKEFRGWLDHSPEINALYEEKSFLFDQLSSEVRTFIQTRNDAAHGLLEVLEGKELLLRYCVLIRALITAIESYFHKNLLMQRAHGGYVQRIGEVTEVFVKPGAFVAEIEAGSEMRLGMSVHFVSQSYCVKHQIESLQINGTAVDQVIADKAAFEVGIKCAINPRRKAEIYVDAST
jgi:hypothetical protein